MNPQPLLSTNRTLKNAIYMVISMLYQTVAVESVIALRRGGIFNSNTFITNGTNIIVHLHSNNLLFLCYFH